MTDEQKTASKRVTDRAAAAYRHMAEHAFWRHIIADAVIRLAKNGGPISIETLVETVRDLGARGAVVDLGDASTIQVTALGVEAAAKRILAAAEKQEVKD